MFLSVFFDCFNVCILRFFWLFTSSVAILVIFLSHLLYTWAMWTNPVTQHNSDSTFYTFCREETWVAIITNHPLLTNTHKLWPFCKSIFSFWQKPLCLHQNKICFTFFFSLTLAHSLQLCVCVYVCGLQATVKACNYILFYLSCPFIFLHFQGGGQKWQIGLQLHCMA